jgi:hypothetical protein
MADLTIVPGDVQNTDTATILDGDAAENILAGQVVYKIPMANTAWLMLMAPLHVQGGGHRS